MTTTSFLDQDFYQFTTAQLIFDNFQKFNVKYKLTCRNAEVTKFFQKINKADLEELKNFLANLKITKDEIDYLRELSYFSEGFLEWLSNYRFQPDKHLDISYHDNYNYDYYGLHIEGDWLNTIFYEIFILSWLNERYSERTKTSNSEVIGKQNLNDKIDLLELYKLPVKIVEFGTRRRFSKDWQKYVLEELNLRVPEYLRNTSNVLLAKEFDMRPTGTMSHQLMMALQSKHPIQNSQKAAWNCWLTHFPQLNIVLSDTLGEDKFFKDFDNYFAHSFSGVRQDSGDPIKFGTRLIKHYKKLDIDPLSKTLVCSDGLVIKNCITIQQTLGDKIKLVFGVGTNLTNDCGFIAPQIVIKIFEANGQPVVKLADNKTSCGDEIYLEYSKHAVAHY